MDRRIENILKGRFEAFHPHIKNIVLGRRPQWGDAAVLEDAAFRADVARARDIYTRLRTLVVRREQKERNIARMQAFTRTQRGYGVPSDVQREIARFVFRK